MITPNKEHFLKLAKSGNIIPVYTDLVADVETPLSVYALLSKDKPSFLFESVTGGEQISRYSFIGCRPRATIECFESKTIIQSAGQKQELETPKDPLKVVEAYMSDFKAVKIDGMPRFHGGAVGYLAYEYIHSIEPSISKPQDDPLGMPLLYYMITESLVIFDHARQIIRVCVNAFVDDDPQEAYTRATAELKSIVQMLKRSKQIATQEIPMLEPSATPSGNFTQESFKQIVETAKEYIRSGDAIQIVGSQRFTMDYEASPIDLYRALRVVNPSPYMFILETGENAIVGASPEVHVRLTDSLVELRPIAGTRPRGKDSKEDEMYEAELLADDKEKAEHLMLVDLARNDIGKVCLPGKVHVPEYMIVEHYSHVMHIVSQVEGELDPQFNAYDVMRATFPAGTVSGAPKVRAMQIIAELEETQRGVYAGALGYFGFDGNLDSCIAIRTAVIKNKKLYIQSGAGLVADSNPGAEYEETLNKARAMLKAVDLSLKIRND